MMKKKKQKAPKKCDKKTLKFQDQKLPVLEAAPIRNKINHLEKIVEVDSLKEFIKINKLILTQRRFKSERHNVFT